MKNILFFIQLSFIIIAIIIPSLSVASTLPNAKIIHSVENEFGFTVVYENKDLRCLSFGDPNKTQLYQTCIFQKDHFLSGLPYTNEILGALYIKPFPKSALVLGMGGGIITKQLNYLIPDLKIDVVDINPEVFKVAKKYFKFSENENIQVHILDAMDYVDKILLEKKQYDLIIIDIYDDNYVPTKFITEEFVEKLKTISSSSGMVAFNTIPNLSKDNDYEGYLYKNAFGKFYTFGSSNRLIMASKDELPTKDKIENNAELWKYKFKTININYKKLLSQLKTEN